MSQTLTTSTPVQAKQAAREIVFRAWDNKKKTLLSWFDLFVDFPLVALLGCHRYTIMQYTGLKDPTRKEIYEADIIKIRQWTKDRTRYKDFFIAVEFHDGSFVLPFTNLGEYRFRDGLWWQVGEVVGNIFEHPHLLK